MIRSRRTVRFAWYAGAAAGALVMTSPGLAQVPVNEPEAPQSTFVPDDSGEIIVTARRREEILQDVPIAVTAYSGEQLEQQGALDITDVGDTTPNVTLETSRGTNTTLTAFIRGVGQQDPVAGFEQGVGIYIDDVYLNRPQQALLDIFDVERIEILRGPQGTLYGRNTIGGAIKYVTRRLSDEPELRVRANVGTDEQADLIVSGSTPIAGSVRAGAAYARLSRGGFGRNFTLDHDNYNKDIHAARGTLEAEPSVGTFFRLSGDYTWDNANPRGGHRLVPGMLSGAPVLDNVFDSRGALDEPEQKIQGGGVSGRAEFDLGSGLTLRSITAYREDESFGPIDFDALPAVDVDVAGLYENEQFSQEVQLLIERGLLNGLVGAYYLNAKARTAFDVRAYTTGALFGAPGLTLFTDSHIDTKAWAIFGDFTYDLTDQFSLSAGARYTVDRRKGDILRQTFIFGGSPLFGGSEPFDEGILIATTSDFEAKRKDTAFTPRASLSFKPNDNHNFYLSYARGFKGGGFDPRGQASQAPVQTPEGIFEYMSFEPETVDSYEIGWKGSALDRRLAWAIAAFHADYEDVQIPASVGCIVNNIPTFCGLTSNAGKARFRGLEVETFLRAGEDMLTAGDRLRLSGTLGYIDAKFKEFVTGVAFSPTTGLPISPIELDVADFREVQNTPKWTASGTFNYDVPVASGRLNLNSTLSYRSKSQQFEFRIPGLDQKGFALLDANLVWRAPDDRWSVGLHGKNLTDKRYILGGYNFFLQNPFTGEFILPNGSPGMFSTVGREGILTAYYGNPRQLFISLGFRF